MEPILDAPVPDDAPVRAELVVQNGRLKGTRRPLAAPLTLVGRAACCDVRLTVAEVRDLHCILAHTADGMVLRLPPGAGPTLLNGEPAADGPLVDGDVISVGPFQFRLRVRGRFPAELAADALAAARAEAGRLRDQAEHEREALRIQAAAVVAQQAALGEEETRLLQRRAALEQQQEQLSAHLEAKRRRLEELREQIKAEHAAVRADRAAREARHAEALRELETQKAEIADGREQLHADRERLRHLRRRLKQRWHRHWAAERAAYRRRDEELAEQRRALAREEERLQQERERLARDRLAFNGDAELGRRKLQAAWEQFRQAQQREADRRGQERRAQAERRAALDEREVCLADAERALAAEQEHWQQTRQALEREAEGLENRVRNFRRKIFDQEQEVRRLEAALHDLRANAPAAPAAAGGKSEPAAAPAARAEAPPARPAPTPVPAEAPQLEQLEQLSGEVADQRLLLVEYCQRLAQAQQHWQQQREAAAAELETVARRLGEREQSIEEREGVLLTAETRLRQQQREATHLQHYLEGWQSRMTARESAWRGERDRLLHEVQQREQLTEQRLRAVSLVQQRWTSRRRREAEWLKAERTACEKLRREYAGLRDQWLRRGAALEKLERDLAERALALEQHQQEVLGQSADSAAAARRLDKLRRRWEALSAAAFKELAEQRKALEEELADLKHDQKHLHKQAARLSTLEEELSQRQTQWEQKELLVEDELTRLRGDLEGTRTQRDRFEKQVHELRDEVERLARLLLDEAEPVHVPSAQAA